MTTAATTWTTPSADTLRAITPPPREGRLGSALTVLSIAAIASSMFHGPAWKTPVTIAFLAMLTAASAAQRAWTRTHLALGGTLLVASMALGWIWPFPGLLALAVYGAVVLVVPPLRRSAGWLRRGAFDRAGTRFFPVAIALPAVSLLGWFLVFRPDLASYQVYPAGMPLWIVAPGALVFAMLIAATEEMLWRGIVMQATDAAFGAGWVSLSAQAIGFGVWHYHGFPGGPVGVGLAAIFAAMMGYLRRRSRGLLVPWLAHVCADSAILAIILFHTYPG